MGAYKQQSMYYLESAVTTVDEMLLWRADGENKFRCGGFCYVKFNYSRIFLYRAHA